MNLRVYRPTKGREGTSKQYFLNHFSVHVLSVRRIFSIMILMRYRFHRHWNDLKHNNYCDRNIDGPDYFIIFCLRFIHYCHLIFESIYFISLSCFVNIYSLKEAKLFYSILSAATANILMKIFFIINHFGIGCKDFKTTDLDCLIS